MKLASYACFPDKSMGRMHKEKYDNNRSPFMRDRDRIIHSMAFRRLEYKTQVFVNHVGDHYRTRLTHSLEVSQIARVIARELAVDEDLTETIALSHDLGHPPFGHAGEDGLNDAAKQYGGFDHNAQAIKIVTQLEQRYAEFDGLNLSWETLEGICKHNGPLEGPNSKHESAPKIISDVSEKFNLMLDSQPSIEAQIAALADDIAYCNHDIDDGIRAGIFALEDLKEIDKIGEIYAHVKAEYPKVNDTRLLNETIRRLMKHMVNDLVTETKKNIEFAGVETVQDVRKQNNALVRFSKETDEMKDNLKAYLMENMYKNYQVNRMTSKGKIVLKDLFNKLMAEPNCLPTEWYKSTKGINENEKAEIIIDYIAGMTDRYAMEEHKKLFDPNYF